MYKVSKRALDIILAIIVIVLLGWFILIALIIYKTVFGNKPFFSFRSGLAEIKKFLKLSKFEQ